MMKNRKIAAKIEEEMTGNPEKMAKILERVSAFEKMRVEKKVSIYSFIPLTEKTTKSHRFR